MDGGIPRVGAGYSAQRADRVGPKREREREEQADFAEAMEQRAHDDPRRHPESPKIGPELPDLGYPSEDEAGASLDLKA